MMRSKKMIFTGLQVHAKNQFLKNTSVVVSGQKIFSIGENHSDAVDAEILEFPETYYLVPGFIDLHVHGVQGADVMDGNVDALKVMSAALAAEGTTGFLATTMTASVDEIEKSICAVRDFMSMQDEVKGAAILGVHLEGPFISPQKVGAQSVRSILMPDKAVIERWQKISNNAIKLVTLAPELENSSELIHWLKEKNIIASLGHTDATYEQAQAAIFAGCSHATHLFNAMRGLHQREPGVTAAALLSEKVIAELIVDGVHVHPAMVELALRVKGKDKLVLVTDAMRAKCLPDGVYDLGGQAVTVKDQVARLANGVLAGSVLKLSSALKNLLEFTGCGFQDALQMVTENPARELGIFDRKGSVEVGKDADLVVLNEKFEVVMTMCGGRVVSS